MKTARHGYQVAYNAQTAVDGKHGLIVAFALTNDCNDERQLQPMAEAATVSRSLLGSYGEGVAIGALGSVAKMRSALLFLF